MNGYKNKRILLTGCAGFMCSHIVEDLYNRGFTKIYGIDDLSGGFSINVHPKCQFYKVDLANGEHTQKYIAEIKPEIVYHLAASAHEGASQFRPKHITNANYMGFINLITSCLEHGCLEKFINFSSMAAYGNQKPPFKETLKLLPEDIYGVNKAAMEKSLEILSDVYGFDYVTIRPHNVLGIRQNIADPHRNVAAIFMNRIMRDEPLFIYGDGKQKRAFSGIEYSLPCYINCLELKTNETINIGGKEPITINELADAVCSSMGVSLTKYPRIHMDDRPREVKYAWTTYQKSEELLGYNEPHNGWINTIKSMAEWAKGQGPKEWMDTPLELINDKTPKTWLPNFNPLQYIT